MALLCGILKSMSTFFTKSKETRSQIKQDISLHIWENGLLYAVLLYFFSNVPLGHIIHNNHSIILRLQPSNFKFHQIRSYTHTHTITGNFIHAVNAFVSDYENLQVPEQIWKVHHELYAIVSQQIKIKHQTAESLVI